MAHQKGTLMSRSQFVTLGRRVGEGLLTLAMFVGAAFIAWAVLVFFVSALFGTGSG